MIFSFNALKPGLLSKNSDVCLATCRLYQKLTYNFGNSALIDAAWDWLIEGDNSGLSTFLLGLRRHSQLKEEIVQILLSIG